MTFGEKLRALRQSKKLTQEELAASLRITSRTLINYEQGRCLPKQTEVLARIATLFNVSVDYLMNEDEVYVPSQGKNSAASEVQQFINDASALFAGGRLSDEDRDYVVRAINDLYWESREARYRLPSDDPADDTGHAS